MPERTAKQIYNQIQNSEHILLIPHQNPDGDALGSVTALIRFLEKLEKKYTAFCPSEISAKLQYLPYINRITKKESIWQNHSFDLIIVLDSGDLRYAGIDKHIERLEKVPTIINIDHHPTNEHFADYNLVIPTASSTTEILYKFFKYNNHPIDRKMATSLLTGLISDTDNFTNPGTNVGSLKTASNLIQYGGKLNTIKNFILKDKPINTLRLWGEVLSRLSKHEEHEIIYTYVTREDLKKYKVEETEAGGIANFLNNLQEGKASLILKELPDEKISGSFRTTQDDFDVSCIAKKLGGGGHKKAAGFTIPGTIDSVLDKVWGILSEK